MAHRFYSYGSALGRALPSGVLAVAAMTIASTAAAHPGHGVTPAGDSAAHYLLEPVHGLGMVAVLAVAVAAGLIIRTYASGRRSSL